jgi:CubicO group peptidase (beta-lactamase class C family)
MDSNVLNNVRSQFESSDVNLDNWKDFPFSAHAFQNVKELIPVQPIDGSGNSEFPQNFDGQILDRTYKIQGQELSGKAFLEKSYTNALLAVKNGEIVSEYFANGMTMKTPHLTFSVSKSITGIVSGMVLKKFGVSTSSKISEIIQTPAGSAYSEATIRNLLDMSVSLDFDEVYTSKEGPYARYRQAMLWMARNSSSTYADEDLAEFILTLPKGTHDHGYMFAYKSPNSDLLGLVLQEISGLPLPQLISEELWKPLGCDPATITVDNKQMARTAGGLSCSIKDLALIGELMRTGGIHNGESLIDPMWVVDTFGHGDKMAWSNGEFYESFPEGSYRNQWYTISEGELCAIGIHGQWIYINTEKETVITKFSCQPKADDDALDRQTIDFFRGVCDNF